MIIGVTEQELQYALAQREEQLRTALAQVQKLKQFNRYLIEDSCQDDTVIRDLCRPIIGENKADHDGYAVVPLADVVRETIQTLQGHK